MSISNSAGDSSGKNKKRRVGAWRDLSRWKPTDDLALITAVKQVGQAKGIQNLRVFRHLMANKDFMILSMSMVGGELPIF